MKDNPKKEIALSFQNLIVSGMIRAAYDKYVSPSFTHHNPYVNGDRESLIRAMEENETKYPDKVFQIQRALEDGEFVSIHSRLQLDPHSPIISVVHIFRFEDDYIVEEWDVAQLEPETSLNENGMF